MIFHNLHNLLTKHFSFNLDFEKKNVILLLLKNCVKKNNPIILLTPGYVRVKWDCGNVGKYRHGAQNAYDLDIVDEPRMLPDDVLIAEGVYVRKGIVLV